MPNSCDVKKQVYERGDYYEIATSLLIDDIQDVFDEIRRDYIESIAKAIISAIKDGSFNENWSVPVESPSPAPTQFNVNGAKNSETEQDELLNYYLDKNNLLESKDRMATRFFEDVISKVLYDKTAGKYLEPSTELVNNALYQYKLELLQKLWDFTGIDHSSDVADEDLTLAMSRTFNDFLSKFKSNDSDEYYDTYVILKNFNKLLNDNAPFIKLNAAYANSNHHAKDMYVWDPSGTYRQSWTDSEDSDISKTVSPLIRLLADYFTTDQGVPIGFKTYNIVMSTVAIWIHENSIDSDVAKVNKELRTKGLHADFGKMIDVYINKTSPNEGMKQVLLGIKKHIFNRNSTLPSKIKDAFANQFFLTAKYAYVAYRQNYENGSNNVKGQYLEDSFIDTQIGSLNRRVQNNVWMYQQNSTLFEGFKKTHGIETKLENGIIKIDFDSRYGESFTVTIDNNNSDSISIKINGGKGAPSNIDYSQLITLIQDLLDELVPDDYADILMRMSMNAPVRATLFGTFIHPISIVLGAATDKQGQVFQYDEDSKDLKTYNFKQYFSQCGTFESIKNGINELNVLKNGEGNNLPIYQLSPAVFDIFTLIDEMYDAGETVMGKSLSSMNMDPITGKSDSAIEKKIVKSVNGKNIFITIRGLLKKMIVRSDVKIGNRTKSSDKLTVAEVGSLAIFNDFYQNLFALSDAKNPNEFAGNIILQPITYSDKKSHFLPLIDLSKLTLNVGINSEKATKVFQNLVNPKTTIDDRKACIKSIRDLVIKTRHDKTKKQIWNQYLRFYSVFSKDANYLNVKFEYADGRIIDSLEAKTLLKVPSVRMNTFSEFNEDDGFKYVSNILTKLNQFKNPIEILRQMFKNQGALLSEDFDVLEFKDGSLQANETLYFNYKTFNNEKQRFLDKYISRQQTLLALDLIENGVEMDEFDHPEIKSYMRSFPENGTYNKQYWYDENAGIMRIARFFRNGSEIIPTQAEIESDAFRHDPEITVLLNPMIEGYFYANLLFSDQLNQIELGGTEGYIPKRTEKIDFTQTNDDEIEKVLSQIQKITASRLANEFKRTTYEGAIKRKFALGLPAGMSGRTITAMVEDEEPLISTLRGDTDGQVAQDGAGLCMPTLHRMQQESLVDSPVGTVKKTIAGWVDPRTGTQNHFKWAETVLTMDMRQRSERAEKAYKKAYSKFDITKKLQGIKNLEMYYNPYNKSKIYEISEHKITETEYIYRYNIDEGYYERLDAIKLEGNEISAFWTAVDPKGNPIKDIHRIEPTPINTLYDIDQAFGGRFTYELNNGQFVTSEKVHDILYNIIWTNDMKEDFIGYYVNHSAAKAGAVNMNSSDIFDNDDEVNTFYISSFGIGVQMDADHEMDFASVTEMGQMISLLTQGGYNVDLVNHAYEDIGRVAAEVMRDLLAAVNTDDSSIYRIIGKALLDTFDSGTREELGLAQAFIRNTQNAILKETGQENIILPYSAESVRGSFIAAVTSLINKRGIRRKYAGFGAVQVPAEGIMQYYTLNGIHYNYVSLRDKIRPILKEHNITWEQANSEIIINGELNPFIKPINQKDIEWEDTIVIENNIGEFSEPIKITNGSLFDKYRNLIDTNEYTIYRWETKSKELTQNDLRYTVTEITPSGSVEHTVSEFDIDPVRAAFYIDELIAYKNDSTKSNWLENNQRKLNVIKAAINDNDLRLSGGYQIGSIANIESFSKDFLKNLKKLCINKAQNYFNDLSRIAKSGKPGTLPVQMSTVNDDFEARAISTQTVSPQIKNITARVILGRRNFKQFLLKKGDKLSDIKEQGWNFFYDRLVSQGNELDKVRYLYPRSRYDGIMRLSNGDNLLVLVGDQSENFEHYNQKTSDFVVSDNSVSYKGKELFDSTKLKGLCNISDLSFYSCIANDGTTLNVIHVPNFAAFDRIRTSDAVIDSQYNYNSSNFVDLLHYKYDSHFNEDGTLKSKFKVGNVEITKKVIEESDDVWDLLNGTESYEKKSRLEQRAKILYRNFMHQLHYIQTRIPAQAMQSTMNIEVIDFADTDMNYIWVPKMLMKLQGSDLDIDKAYCMGYDVNDAGNISALSDLIKIDKYDVDDILLLSTPNGAQIRVNMPQHSLAGTTIESIDFTDTLVNLLPSTPITILNKLLEITKSQDNRTVNLIIDWNDPRVAPFNTVFDEYVNDANVHNLSTRSEREKEAALRNQVLAAARKIMNDPASQLNAYTPIAMSEPRSAAQLNTALGSKEQEMTLDNPASIYIMQKQNMSGKEVIAMTATGIKSYFIVTTYFNTLAKKLEGLLEQYTATPSEQIGDQIVEILNEITFDGKLDNSTAPVLRTFANINFYRIKQLVNSFKARYPGENIIYNSYIESNANTAFKQYADNGILKIDKLINDLDRRANGNVWQIKSNSVSDIAIRLSELLDDDITIDKVQELLSDGEELSRFLRNYQSKVDDITDILFNSNYYEYFVINAPDSLSALLSAATDNAKELILDKLNATSKFADIYTTLLSQGVPFITIAQMMTNNAFRIVAKYSQDNIFDPSTSFFSVENALKFVLNDGQLPNVIQKGLFEKFLTDTEESKVNDVISHRHTGFYALIKNVKLNSDETLSTKIYKDFIKAGVSEESVIKTIKDAYPIYKRSDIPENKIIELIINYNGAYSWKNIIAKVILNLFNDNSTLLQDGVTSLGNYLKTQLQSNLVESIKAYASGIKSSGNQDYSDVEQNLEPDIADIIGDDDYETILTSRTTSKSDWYKGSIGKTQLISIYRYAKKYFIPKTELWNALSDEDRRKAIRDFERLSTDVLYAAKEMKMLGSFGSINQGLRPKDFDEYKFIKGVNKFINTAYMYRAKDENFEEFDLLRFITETTPKDGEKESYHDKQLRQYDKVKAAVNILTAIDYTGNFKEMFRYIATNRNIIEHSVAVKMERRLEDELLRSCQPTHNGEETGISLATTKVLDNKEFRTLSQYVRDLIVFNFFTRRNDLHVIVPKNISYYHTNTTDGEPKLDEKGLGKDHSITLNNVVDLATFKHLMDTYIIPKLKTDPRFKNNAFLKNLILDKMLDEKSRVNIRSYKVNVPLININDSPKAKQMYSRVLSDFNKLLYCPIDQGLSEEESYGIGNWTIGNLFYIYNLLVNKDRIGQNALTRLFEDLISSGNNQSLAGEYYKYISDLDKGEIQIFKEDGWLDPTKFAYDLRDLKYRLSGSDRAKKKFGVEESKTGRKVNSITIFDNVNDENGLSRDVSDDPRMLSDFILNLPYSTSLEAFKQPDSSLSRDFNDAEIIMVSDETVFTNLANELANTYGSQIPMEMLTEEEIEQEFGDREDVDQLKQNVGFIIDGNIYLNLTKASLDAPLHEIMHFIAAAMKFSGDPDIRHGYYQLLDWITDWLDGKVQSGSEDDAILKQKIVDKNGAYANRHMSDVKEEILVTLLAREFKNRFSSLWGESKTISKDRIHAAVKMTVAKIFNDEKIKDVDFNDLGNAKLLSVLKKFTSQILTADTNLSMVLEQNQELAELKHFLIQNEFITLSKDCL